MGGTPDVRITGTNDDLTPVGEMTPVEVVNSTIVLKGFHVDYAYWSGISMRNSFARIRNCLVENCTWGVFARSSFVSLRDSEIRDSVTYGFYGIFAEVQSTDIWLHDNHAAGFRLQSSNVRLLGDNHKIYSNWEGLSLLENSFGGFGWDGDPTSYAGSIIGNATDLKVYHNSTLMNDSRNTYDGTPVKDVAYGGLRYD